MKTGTAVLVGGVMVAGLVGVALAAGPTDNDLKDVPIPSGFGFPFTPNTSRSVKASSGRTYTVYSFWPVGPGKQPEFNVCVRTGLAALPGAPKTWISYVVDATTKARTMFKAAAAQMSTVGEMRTDWGLTAAAVRPA